MKCVIKQEWTIFRFVILKKQIDVSFSCVCPVINDEFCHKIIKVVCRSTQLLGSCQFSPMVSSPPPSSPPLSSSPHQLICMAIKCLKFIFLLPRKNDNIETNHTKHVYFSFFNPLKVNDELEIKSLGWVHGGELSGGKLAMGWNLYKPAISSRGSPTTLTMLWRNSSSEVGQTQEKLTSIC